MSLADSITADRPSEHEAALDRVEAAAAELREALVKVGHAIVAYAEDGELAEVLEFTGRVADAVEPIAEVAEQVYRAINSVPTEAAINLTQATEAQEEVVLELPEAVDEQPSAEEVVEEVDEDPVSAFLSRLAEERGHQPGDTVKVNIGHIVRDIYGGDIPNTDFHNFIQYLNIHPLCVERDGSYYWLQIPEVEKPAATPLDAGRLSAIVDELRHRAVGQPSTKVHINQITKFIYGDRRITADERLTLELALDTHDDFVRDGRKFYVVNLEVQISPPEQTEPEDLNDGVVISIHPEKSEGQVSEPAEIPAVDHKRFLDLFAGEPHETQVVVEFALTHYDFRVEELYRSTSISEMLDKAYRDFKAKGFASARQRIVNLLEESGIRAEWSVYGPDGRPNGRSTRGTRYRLIITEVATSEIEDVPVAELGIDILNEQGVDAEAESAALPIEATEPGEPELLLEGAAVDDEAGGLADDALFKWMGGISDNGEFTRGGIVKEFCEAFGYEPRDVEKMLGRWVRQGKLRHRKEGGKAIMSIVGFE